MLCKVSHSSCCSRICLHLSLAASSLPVLLFSWTGSLLLLCLLSFSGAVTVSRHLHVARPPDLPDVMMTVLQLKSEEAKGSMS